ncbi:MAG: 50S ribosomal protein L29 [Planctomycetes bacterium]|nr:50S ribosomal protein L29 [Planctomycetota bacterium]
MTFDALRGQPEKELQAKLNQLAEENFKARFTTEAMTSQRGAEILNRRREIARIRTVLSGRKALERAKAEQTKLDAKLNDLGKPHEGDEAQKRARTKLQNRLGQVKRTIRELEALAKGK